MSAKHTPSPWTVVRRRDGLAIQPVGLILMGEHDEHSLADIALAAAAPDLLEALAEVLREFDLDDQEAYTGRQRSALYVARAAVAKARGGE